MSTGLAGALLAALAAAPDKVRLVCEGEEWTGARMLDAVAGRRAMIDAAGIGAGACVLALAGRGADYWIDMLAIWAAGAVFVPFDPGIDGARAAVLADKARASLVVGDPGGLPEAFATLPRLPEGGAPADAAAPVDAAGDLAAVLFTSGSTGRPKGVALSHAAVLGNARGILSVLDLRPADRLFIAIPFHFTSGICHFLAAMLAGATLVATERKLLKADLAKALQAGGATAFGGAPVQLRWIAECAGQADLSGLRWLMSSGDHLSTEVISALAEVLPSARVYTVYGLTELAGRFCVLPPEALPAAAGAVGRPIPGLSVAVLGEDGEALPAGEVGEVVASGELLFSGYYNDPEITAQCLDARGLRTGDLGFLDEHGLLRLVGRTDDVFKVSGQKVATPTIAEALLATGAFDDVAVIGRDHPVAGTVPFVFFVPRAGRPFDQGEVMRALRASLPANHMPHGFAQVDAIPRTGSGKVKRGELRQMQQALGAKDAGR